MSTTIDSEEVIKAMTEYLVYIHLPLPLERIYNSFRYSDIGLDK